MAKKKKPKTQPWHGPELSGNEDQLFCTNRVKATVTIIMLRPGISKYQHFVFKLQDNQLRIYFAAFKVKSSHTHYK